MARVCTLLAGLALAATAAGTSGTAWAAEIDTPPAIQSDEPGTPPCEGSDQPEAMNKQSSDHSGEATTGGILEQSQD